MQSAAPPAWTRSDFASLDAAALYALLRLRSEVFVVEQACAFQDLDGLDQRAVHLQGHEAGELVAYARCFPPRIAFEEASIGRIVTRAAARGTGLGHALLDQAVRCVGELWGVQAIRIGAQTRLKHFYQGHGFVDVGRPYLEDGIDHIEMVWTP